LESKVFTRSHRKLGPIVANSILTIFGRVGTRSTYGIHIKN
jgi:hypothetical protein